MKRGLDDETVRRLAGLIRERVLAPGDTATVEEIMDDLVDWEEPIALLAGHLMAELDRAKATVAEAEAVLDGRRLVGGRFRG